MLVVLKLRMPVAALRFTVKTSEIPPALAIRIAASVEFTGDTLAVKLALLAPAATVTAAGTLTSELLLDSPTENPPLAAGVFRVTVQLSVPDPMIELSVQLSAVSPGMPVPSGQPPSTYRSRNCWSSTVAPPVHLPLWIELHAQRERLAGSQRHRQAPAGDRKTCPRQRRRSHRHRHGAARRKNQGLSGRRCHCDAAESHAGGADPQYRCRCVQLNTQSLCHAAALAVSIAACAEGTAEALAENCALVAPAGTVTEAGTVTALSLLVRLTARPPLAAAAFNVTVQVSIAVPVMDPLTHVNSVSNGTPVPLSATEVELPFDALLAMVTDRLPTLTLWARTGG